jgi:DNA-binding MarR family transcriptional regulator
MKKSAKWTPSGAALSALILEIFRLNGRLLLAGDRLVAQLGLTSARWQVLGAIAMAPAPQPVAWLARSMGLNRQSVQRIVGELAAEGFVELRANPHHKTAKLVLLTAQGVAAHAGAMRLQLPWVNALGEGIDAKSLEDAAGVLEALRHKLDPERR